MRFTIEGIEVGRRSRAGERVDADIREKIRRDMAEREADARRTTILLTRVFVEGHSRRGRFDPRRLGDRYVVWRLMQLVRLSEAKAAGREPRPKTTKGQQ